MEALQHKFLSAEERAMAHDDPQLITLLWSVKEAAYKWQGRRGVEFADHLNIKKIEESEHNYNITLFMQLTQPRREILSQGIVKQDFCLLAFNGS